MDVCVGFLIFGIVLFIVALFGHAAWLVGAMLVRGLFETVSRPPDRDGRGPAASRVRCVRCGTVFPRLHPSCPSCRLDPGGPVAREFADLETTARSLQALVNRGALDPGLAETVYHGIEARQAHLVRTNGVVPADRRQQADGGRTPRERLERLLGPCPDPVELSLASRNQALSWWKELPDDECGRLSAGTLLAVGGLLRTA